MTTKRKKKQNWTKNEWEIFIEEAKTNRTMWYNSPLTISNRNLRRKRDLKFYRFLGGFYSFISIFPFSFDFFFFLLLFFFSLFLCSSQFTWKKMWELIPFKEFLKYPSVLITENQTEHNKIHTHTHKIRKSRPLWMRKEKFKIKKKIMLQRKPEIVES